jgi:large subunit ribosomal protein L14
MQIGTIVKIADNSGPMYLRVIKVLKKSSKSHPVIGDYIIGSVLRTHERKKFKVSKGSIVRALVIRCAENYRRKDLTRLRFQHPAAVIITKSGLPRATKIYGPIPKELRERGFIRIVSLSTIAL